MSEALRISINSNIKRIECNGYGDEILIDVSDASVFDKFNAASEELDNLQKEYNKEADEIKERFPDETDTDALVEVARFRIKYINRMIGTLDAIFGRGTVRKVFRENYELNEDFIPDEELLMEFLDQMIPIMEDLYKKRADKIRGKYSPDKRGKNTR